jgi:hypothetical protein
MCNIPIPGDLKYWSSQYQIRNFKFSNQTVYTITYYGKVIHTGDLRAMWSLDHFEIVPRYWFFYQRLLFLPVSLIKNTSNLNTKGKCECTCICILSISILMVTKEYEIALLCKEYKIQVQIKYWTSENDL